MAYIYKITNSVSGKCYIGETTCKNPEERWRRHKETIRRGVGCPALRDAVQKYGIDAFRFEVIRTCSLEERFDIERETIKEYNSVAPGGYNILPGGAGGGFLGKKHKAESIVKMKEGCKKFREENPNYYETYKEKHREAVRNAGIGKKVKSSEAFKKACEEGRVGAAGWKTTKTEEEKNATKEKIRQSIKKYYDTHKDNTRINIESHRDIMTKVLGKQIDQYSLEDEYITTHSSISEAARKLNKNRHTNIQNALDSPTRTAYGFRWKTHQPKDNE
jgi:group I intron endonuclease